MQTTLKRREFLRVGVATLAGSSALGLISCGGGGGSGSSPTVPLKLEFWGTTERDKRTRQVVTLFGQSHPNVKITSQFTDFYSYWVKLGTEISGGNEPDLLQMDLSYLAQFIQKGLLLDLTKYIPRSINLSDFDQVLLKGSEDNNTIYGIPLGGNYQAAFYRTDLLAQAGVGDPDPNMTWEEFADYTARISRALGKGVWGTDDGSNNAIIFEVFLRQHGKEMYTTDGQINYSKQDLIDWWTYWDNMRKSGACLPPSLGAGAPTTTTTTPPDSPMINGKSVFHFDWSNLIVAWQKFSPHKLGMAVFPQGPAGSQMGHYFKVSQMMSISSKTKYPDEAASFIDFMINNPGAVKALDIERGIPGSARAQQILKPQLTPVQQEELTYISLAAKYSRPKVVLDPPAAGQVTTLFQLYAGKVAFGQVSISAGVDQFFSDAQKALSQGQKG
ncbi:MAG: sugar ABC transporter substrate-binding protein [Chloroflexi bacterium]|nr:sugar ABC transporter substrate-binding protein [Chloroflexota bacterium]